MRNRKFWVSLLAGALALLMVLSIVASLIPTKVSAASSSEIQAEIDVLEAQEAEIQAQIDELNGQLSANLSEMTAIVEQKKILDQQIGLLQAQIANTNAQIAAYNDLIADKQDELDIAQTRYNELSEQNKERIRAMEEEGTLSYWSVLFKANNFSDLLDRLNMMEEIAAADQRRMLELSEAAAEVESAKEALETEKANLEATKEQLAASQEELNVKSAEATALLDELRAQGAEFEALMAVAEEEQSSIMLQLEDKNAELEEAQYQEWLASQPPASGSYGGDTTPSSSVPNSSGWISPIQSGYTLSSPFGMRIHPIYGDWRMHYGVDMGCAQGTPIYAAKGGTVIGAGWNDSMGWYVRIDHGDGFTSIYMHMTHHIVYYGDSVSQGQVIGYVGSTGDSTGPHLHFGIAYNGTYVNPMEYV